MPRMTEQQMADLVRDRSTKQCRVIRCRASRDAHHALRINRRQCSDARRVVDQRRTHRDSVRSGRFRDNRNHQAQHELTALAQQLGTQRRWTIDDRRWPIPRHPAIDPLKRDAGLLERPVGGCARTREVVGRNLRVVVAANHNRRREEKRVCHALHCAVRPRVPQWSGGDRRAKRR